jgi:hypothetical protein
VDHHRYSIECESGSGFFRTIIMTNNAETFDAFFRRADTDRDGRISGAEAVAFFQGANLPQLTLAKVFSSLGWISSSSQIQFIPMYYRLPRSQTRSQVVHIVLEYSTNNRRRISFLISF